MTMSDISSDPGAVDEVVDTLLALPPDRRVGAVRERMWPAEAIVERLAERSLALLDDDPTRALELAGFADGVAALVPEGLARPLADRAMAHALRMNGRQAAALERYDAAHDGFARRGQDIEAARTLIGKIAALMYLGRYDEAMAAGQTARAALVSQAHYGIAARVDANLGNVFHRLDRPHDALDAYDRARAQFARDGQDVAVAHVDRNRGNALALLNRFEAALDAYAAARAVYQEQAMAALDAETAYNEAYLYFLLGQYSQALTRFAQVRDTFTRLNDQRHLALCDLDEAEVLLALNRPADADELAARAVASFDGLAMRYEAAKARAFGAIARVDGGDFIRAAALLDEAGALFEQEGNVLWVATVGLLRADLGLRQGDPSAALDRCDAALDLLDPGAFPARAGRGRVLRAQALRLLDRRDEADADARDASAVAAVIGDRVLSYQSCHLLGRLQADAGDLDAAAASFDQAIADVDALRGGIARDDLRISFAADKVALYEDAVRHSLRRGRVDEAFEQVERAKARALVDLLADGPAIRVRALADPDGGDARLARRVEQLRAELTALYNRLHGEGEERQRFADGREPLLAQLRRREDELTAAQAALQVRQAGYVALHSASSARLAEVRESLGAREVLLEYYLLGDEVIVFVVTPSGARAYGPLCTRREVDELVGRWRAHLAQFNYGAAFARRHSGGLQATARDVLGALDARLLAPLAERLDGRSIIVVPHGALHHVPFHALYDDRTETYMVERHEVSYMPSATVLARQREDDGLQRGSASGRALIVGVPTPALPRIAAEVAAVAACHHNPLVLSGGAATRARVTVAAANCNHLHLATHAVFRADNPLYSAVQLADDWLTAADLYNLDLKAELAVLSACDTGTGAVLQGDEVIGLTRGLLYAGVRALVVSLWAVNDDATADLMAAFYQAVAAGGGTRHSLRAAQRQEMTRHPHPYYWAPFIAIGRVSGW